MCMRVCWCVCSPECVREHVCVNACGEGSGDRNFRGEVLAATSRGRGLSWLPPRSFHLPAQRQVLFWVLW